MLPSLSARGVAVYAEPCDITDRRAVEKLFETLRRRCRRWRGSCTPPWCSTTGSLLVWTEERFHRVLAPKVKGVENLDTVTRGMTLDYFVLFSSVTTLLGNPGQANYVAANAYMEGVARRRRQGGRTALADQLGPDYRCWRAGALRDARSPDSRNYGGSRHARLRSVGSHGAGACAFVRPGTRRR